LSGRIARTEHISSRVRRLVSRRAVLTGITIAAAASSSFDEKDPDSTNCENGASPTVSPSGPDAELHGAADPALPVQPGEPHQLKYRVGAYSHFDEI
jgi:hypothetical protein